MAAHRRQAITQKVRCEEWKSFSSITKKSYLNHRQLHTNNNENCSLARANGKAPPGGYPPRQAFRRSAYRRSPSVAPKLPQGLPPGWPSRLAAVSVALAAPRHDTGHPHPLAGCPTQGDAQCRRAHRASPLVSDLATQGSAGSRELAVTHCAIVNTWRRPDDAMCAAPRFGCCALTHDSAPPGAGSTGTETRTCRSLSAGGRSGSDTTPGSDRSMPGQGGWRR